MSEFSRAAIFRIFKKAGELRVSEGAIRELSNALEEVGLEVAKQAMELATHAGRRTIMESDVKMAIKTVLRRA
ncbi:MAG: histone [Nitrososphaerota archaeon]